MLKQFNLKNQVFADPKILVDEQGKPMLSSTGELQFTTSGNGWFSVNTQAEINGISVSITGGGEVWEENGKLRYSGEAPSENHKWDTEKKKWIKLTKTETQEKQTALLAQQKAQLIQRLADKTDSLKSGILAGYPQSEIDSFYVQEREAREWQADNNSPTPMLSAIAENRGVPLDILIEKVLEKSSQLASVIGMILGQKQAFEDRLQAVENPQKIAEIAEEIEQWQLNLAN